MEPEQGAPPFDDFQGEDPFSSITISSEWDLQLSAEHDSFALGEDQSAFGGEQISTDLQASVIESSTPTPISVDTVPIPQSSSDSQPDISLVSASTAELISPIPSDPFSMETGSILEPSEGASFSDCSASAPIGDEFSTLNMEPINNLQSSLWEDEQITIDGQASFSDFSAPIGDEFSTIPLEPVNNLQSSLSEDEQITIDGQASFSDFSAPAPAPAPIGDDFSNAPLEPVNNPQSSLWEDEQITIDGQASFSDFSAPNPTPAPTIMTVPMSSVSHDRVPEGQHFPASSFEEPTAKEISDVPEEVPADLFGDAPSFFDDFQGEDPFSTLGGVPQSEWNIPQTTMNQAVEQQGYANDPHSFPGQALGSDPFNNMYQETPPMGIQTPFKSPDPVSVAPAPVTSPFAVPAVVSPVTSPFAAPAAASCVNSPFIPGSVPPIISPFVPGVVPPISSPFVPAVVPPISSPFVPAVVPPISSPFVPAVVPPISSPFVPAAVPPISSPFVPTAVPSISSPFSVPAAVPSMDNTLLNPIARSSEGTYKPSFDYGESPFEGQNADYSNQTTMEVAAVLNRPPRAVITFGFGGKIYICNNRTEKKAIHVHETKTILSNSELYKSLSTYPGPLTQKSAPSTWNKLSAFISQHIQAIEGSIHSEPEDALLWELLAIFVEHKRCDLFQSKRLKKKVKALLKKSDNATEWLGNSGSGNVLKENCVEHFNKQSLLVDIQTAIDEGNQRNAFAIAMENKLYSHALIIGTMLGQQFYGQALSHFVDDNLTEDCSLRSSYLLTSNQSTIDHKQLAQKWRNHISLILSSDNTNKANSMSQLGDQLWKNHYNFIAAHFCYILSGLPFKDSRHPDARLVLVGGDHKRSVHFMNYCSFQQSEILEFLRLQEKKGSDPSVLSLSLFRYKLIYATWLFDLGLVDQSKNYLSQIQQRIRDVHKSDPALGASFQAFSSRLQKHSEGSGSGWTLLSKVVTSIVGSEEPENSKPKKVFNPIQTKEQTQPIMQKAFEPVQVPFHNSAVSPPSFSPSFMNPMTMEEVQPKQTKNEAPRQPTQEPEPPVTPKAPVDPKPKSSSSEKENAKKQGSGFFGYVSSWFGGKDKAKEMDLGGGPSLIFSSKHKMWMPPGVDEDEYAASKKKTSAPPPAAISKTKENQVENTNRIPSAVSAPLNSTASPQNNLMAPRSSRRKRKGYVNPTSSSTTAPNSPSPQAFKPPAVFTPPAAVFTPSPASPSLSKSVDSIARGDSASIPNQFGEDPTSSSETGPSNPAPGVFTPPAVFTPGVFTPPAVFTPGVFTPGVFTPVDGADAPPSFSAFDPFGGDITISIPDEISEEEDENKATKTK